MRLSVSIVIGVTLLLVSGTEGRRGKRTTLALPSKTAATVTFDLSVPINAMATSGAYYNMKLPFRFFIPTIEELTNPSARMGEIDDEMEDYDQQRSHEERRFIYKSIESLVSRYVLFILYMSFIDFFVTLTLKTGCRTQCEILSDC